MTRPERWPWLLVTVRPDGTWSILSAQLDLWDPAPSFLAHGTSTPPRRASPLDWARRFVRLPQHRISWRETSTVTTTDSGTIILVPCRKLP